MNNTNGTAHRTNHIPKYVQTSPHDVKFNLRDGFFLRKIPSFK